MFYSDSVRAAGETAAKKVAYLRQSPLGYLVAAMLAVAYVGVGAFLAFMVGGEASTVLADGTRVGLPWQKAIMGASFVVALSLVVFAGSELFTGNNMVMAIGWRMRKNSFGQLLAIWCYSWFGNLLGCLVLALLLVTAGTLNSDPQFWLVQKIAYAKTTAPVLPLLVKGILCNWLVCLGVWCTYRMKSEAGKLIMIFWCLYAFVACGFEHSVANMTLLSVAFLQPGSIITLAGAGYNLLWSSLGNAIGGALFVGLAYWAASTDITTEAAAAKMPANV
ncbi:MAG TPA: formate/nitrite transporter family protein [Armatimonadota bacterium]|nr:formate/nitrite transporter family protein [Armatimonadota bacterium]